MIGVSDGDFLPSHFCRRSSSKSPYSSIAVISCPVPVLVESSSIRRKLEPRPTECSPLAGAKADVEVAAYFHGHPGKFEFDADKDLSEVEGLMRPDSLTRPSTAG